MAAFDEILSWMKAAREQPPEKMTDCPECGWPLEEARGVLHCPLCGWVSGMPDRITKT